MLPVREISPASVEIFPVTTIFRPVRLMEPVLLAEVLLETVIWVPAVVRFRLLPLMNEAELATVMLAEVELERLTVRLSTKLPVDDQK